MVRVARRLVMSWRGGRLLVASRMQRLLHPDRRCVTWMYESGSALEWGSRFSEDLSNGRLLESMSFLIVVYSL